MKDYEVRIVTVEKGDLKDCLREVVEELLKQYLPIYNASREERLESEELVGTKEACRILACCERTLQRYRASRLVTVIYRGPHRCYYFREELLSLRDANTRPNRDSK